MATWAEQGGSDPVPAIPKCPYLVRRGQAPDYASRSNIIPWNEGLAARSKQWRALTDEDGKLVTELPPVGSSGMSTQAKAPNAAEREKAEKETEEEAALKITAKADMREIAVFEVFSSLGEGDFKPNGMPKVEVVRGYLPKENLTGMEIKKYWLAYQENKGA